MKTEITLENLELVFNVTEPDRKTMEIKLRIIGYSREHLEYLSDREIKRLYYDEFGDIDE